MYFPPYQTGMYRVDRQAGFPDFYLPFGGTLDPGNRITPPGNFLMPIFPAAPKMDFRADFFQEALINLAGSND